MKLRHFSRKVVNFLGLNGLGARSGLKYVEYAVKGLVYTMAKWPGEPVRV